MTMGYHLAPIAPGKYGELSKIKEELEEAIDAEAQGAGVMVINELADMIGAIEGYLEKRHPTISLMDLVKMSNITKRAFLSGRRQPREL